MAMLTLHRDRSSSATASIGVGPAARTDYEGGRMSVREDGPRAVRAVDDRCVSIVLRLALALLLVGNALGCKFQNLDSLERWERGYTLVLPGVEGAIYNSTNMASGLRDAGVDTAIEVYDWTTGNPLVFLHHLQNRTLHATQAEAIAMKIVDYQDEYPGRPVHLVGHSGGAAMLLLATDALPEDRQVSTITLLNAAISPDFDLRPILPKVEQGIWNHSSRLDVLHLQAGTLLFGTVDRKHGVSAGAVGFRRPSPLSDEEAAAYDQKLHEVPYRWSMMRSGHFGGHQSVTNTAFARDYVAPVLKVCDRTPPGSVTHASHLEDTPAPRSSSTARPRDR